MSPKLVSTPQLVSTPKVVHPMDVLVKNDKKTKKKWKGVKCTHVWKEFDHGKVHKKNKGVPHVWYICKHCKTKQSRVKN